MTSMTTLASHKVLYRTNKMLEIIPKSPPKGKPPPPPPPLLKNIFTFEDLNYIIGD